MSTETNQAIVRRYIDEAWNRGNVAVIDELMAPNYLRHINGCPTPLTRESHKQRIIRIHRALPDVHLTIEDMIAAGDRVVSRLTLRGTQRETFMGIPPTGRHVTVSGIDIARLVDGKFVEHWAEMDTLGLMQQLGAVIRQQHFASTR
jgi:steroid delta-isomerase-like uncharacterized protein